jgi:ABC-type transporter Mla MlaB component
MLERVELRRARAIKEANPTAFDGEGVVTSKAAMLLLDGEVDVRTVPHLNRSLDSVVSMSPVSLTVDLTNTARVDLEALAVISRHAFDVERFSIRLPPAAASRVRDRCASELASYRT